MAVLSLPLTFTNSFWSQDYRRGLEVLFAKLEQGTAENDQIVNFIRARAAAEAYLAETLTNPIPLGSNGTGFSADDGASLLLAFNGLQHESARQGEAHKTVATELQTLVVEPFNQWAQSYKERLRNSKVTAVDKWMKSYEQAQGEVAKLKHQYLTKTRKADEAEDTVRFAPTNDIADKYTASPMLNPRDRERRRSPQRTASVSERIAARLREIQQKSMSALSAATSADGVTEALSPVETIFSEEKDTPKVDKGKGKEVTPPVIASPPPMSPPLPPSKLDVKPPSSPMPPPPPSPLLLAGISLPPKAISELLSRAVGELPLRPIRFPLLGEYQDCFTGDEFVTWLKENVDAFGGSFDRAEDAAKDLTEKEGLLRRVGEFGNLFEASDDAFYQFRPKAFELGAGQQDYLSAASPTRGSFAPVTDNLLKRSNTFVSFVSKALNNNMNGTSEPQYARLRNEAEAADKTYRVAVRKLDRQRLALEERIEELLKTLQRWEAERLRAVKAVLLQYQGTLANLPKALDASAERSTTLIAAYNPDNDLTALIERYRSGPFRPDPQVYESVTHDESDVVFGIDLRRWADGGWSIVTGGHEQKREGIPAALTAMLEGLKEAYGKLPNDSEKRKAWIYEVPLPAVHHLREALNAIPPEQPITPEMVAKYDAAVIAAAIKLWLLELDPPVAMYEGWEDFRKLYPTVGSKAKVQDEGERSPEQHIEDLISTLLRLPRVHLLVLDALISHFKTLIDSTTVEEPNEVFLAKLALSVGRTILRPKYETEITLQDRHPTLLFIDLVDHYTEILPPTITRKKRDSERKIPLRKRTAPIDMRLSRSKLPAGADHMEILTHQRIRSGASHVALPVVPEKVLTAEPQTIAEPQPVRAAQEQTSWTSASAAPTSAIALAALPLLSTKSATSSDDKSDLILPSPAATLEVDAAVVPPRPSFKEPPPDDDDLPPRPMFKEPALDDEDLPPRPTFKEPPADDAITPAPVPHFAEPPPEVAQAVPPPATVEVTPPTPLRRNSIKRQSFQRTGSPSPSPLRRMSRSPTPPNDDQPLMSNRVSLARSGSAQATRSPRISRGPRAPGGGANVSSIISTLTQKATSPPPSPNYKPLSRGGSSSSRPGSRPTSIVGRSGVLSRRTMASDAEDEVVDR